jgi:hypothetical protein
MIMGLNRLPKNLQWSTRKRKHSRQENNIGGSVATPHSLCNRPGCFEKGSLRYIESYEIPQLKGVGWHVLEGSLTADPAMTVQRGAANKG